MPKCGFNFIEITLRDGSHPVNLLHFFRTPFYKNTYGGLLLIKDVFIAPNSSYYIYLIHHLKKISSTQRKLRESCSSLAEFFQRYQKETPEQLFLSEFCEMFCFD